MALQRNLSEDELALVEILEDPVWLGEFLRNTSDGSPYKEEWPKMPFKYRWYQKDLLTDKSEFISLTAGRAVGKCSPANARVYTYPDGYLSIRDLKERQNKGVHNICYALDPEKRLVQRRMVITNNGQKDAYKVTTDSGYVFDATENHPILTPFGYVPVKDLRLGDEVGVVTHLPHDSQQDVYNWHELRWLGYAFASSYVGPEVSMYLKYQKQILELQDIAKVFDANCIRNTDGSYTLERKRGPMKHYVSYMLKDLGLTNKRREGATRVPHALKREKLENIKVLLESYFSLAATVTPNTVTIEFPNKTFVLDIQELLLRFGIQSIVTKEENLYKLSLRNYWDFCEFFTTFALPGISVKNIRHPVKEDQPFPFMRFEPVASIEYIGRPATYAITVREDHNYISDNLFVHNSLVLEDKLVFNAVNSEIEFPMSKEATLVTANVSQMTPILDRLILRFTNSPLLKDFLGGNVNRSKGTLDYTMPGGANYRLNARIAGSRGENNMVGLHVPKIFGDEIQLFPMAAWTQLGPTYNSWEPKRQQFFCGVPNGLREGNVLYMLDQRTQKFKKYRIPAHENPFFTLEDNLEALRAYGGVESDDYQRLVLGRHGEASFAVIPRDKIRTEPFEFFSYRYSQTDKHNGRRFSDLLNLVKIPASKSVYRVLAIDTGFTDPTVAQVICRDERGIWRTFARYRLTRIPFPEQSEIINWLDDHYNFSAICIDLGAGGGGIGVSQDLQSDRFPKTKKYAQRIYGVRFADMIVTGRDADGNDLKAQAKSYAGSELSRIITEGQLIFSEIDLEGLSQMERVAYQRQSNGTNQYFIISDKGAGKSKDDHIFASYIVFILNLITMAPDRSRPKLFTARFL